MSAPTPRTRKHITRFKEFAKKHKPIDSTMLIVVSLLVLLGLIMVYESSVVQANKDFGDPYYYIKQQLLWVVLGFSALGIFSKLDYHYLKTIALPLFGFSLLLLLGVFIPGLGISGGGAHRWLRLIGPVSIQPAEIMKLSSIIFFAALFEKRAKLGPFLTIVGLVSLIIGIFQKDLGSTVVFFLTSFSLYIIAGAPLKYLWALMPASLLALLTFTFSSDYRKHRVLAFLNPFSDTQGYSYHISQVLMALGSGGFMGLGLGQSREKYDYIPEVTTDSIFAIIGEEFGFIGALVLMALLSYVILRGFRIANSAGDHFGTLLASGLTAWLGIQAIVNLGSMVALFPLTGVPLPFISYGGSALMANLVAIGILLNISKSSEMKNGR